MKNATKRAVSVKKTKESKIPDIPVRAEREKEEVAELAYSLYLARGSRDGFDLQDWINAEQELRSKRNSEKLR